MNTALAHDFKCNLMPNVAYNFYYILFTIHRKNCLGNYIMRKDGKMLGFPRN